MAQLDAHPTGDNEVASSNPAGSATFVEILYLPLIQEGQLSVSGERMHNTVKLIRGLNLPSKKCG